MDDRELRSEVWAGGLSLKAIGLQTRLETMGADGRPARRSGAGRIKRDAEAGSAAPFPDRLGPSSVSSSALRGPPDRRPDWGGALEGGCPEQERPQSMSFPLFPELTQQGRKSGAKTWP